MAQNPVFPRLANLESKLIDIFAFINFYKLSLSIKLPSFLLGLASDNAFIIKMWPGGTPDVVVGSLRICLDQLLFFLFFFYFMQRRNLVE